MIDDAAPPDDTIRLRTLGTLEVGGPEDRPLGAIVSQSKRAALLVYLAVARPRGLHRRDTLLALLWPEADQGHARHALSQLVYQLRRALGGSMMRSQGDETLGVDTERLWCDAAAFEEALEQERPEDALELYRGDFLTGFHVVDAAPELEEWIATERTRLRSAAATAAWTLAAREERVGNGSGAAHWARRAAALAPDDESAVRRLIDLLARLGDRTGALRAFSEFSRRLQQEFELEPSSALRAVAEELRRASQGASSREAEPQAPPLVDASAHGLPALSPTPVRRRPTVSAATAVIAVAGLAALLASLLRPVHPAPILAVGTVSAFTRGDTATSAAVVADLLATSLARLPSVQVIAMPRLYEVQSQLQSSERPGASLFDAARFAGAREVIQGTVHPSPHGGVRLDLERIDIPSGSIRRAYQADGTDVFAAVDQATAAIALDFRVPAPTAPVADVTTHSVVAYRLFESGLRERYQGDLTAAIRLFRAALDEDSSFAMAAYWVWLSSLGRVSPDTSHQDLERAARLADRATDRERLVIHAAAAEAELDPRWLAVAETLAYRYPTDPEAQLALGRARLNRGNFLPAIELFREVLALDSLGLRGHHAWCHACDAYRWLLAAYVWADSLSRAEQLGREWVGRQPSSPQAWDALREALELRSQDSATLAAQYTADSLRQFEASLEPLRARLAIRRGNYVEADQRLHQLIRDRAGEAEPEWFLAISLRNQGRLREAIVRYGARRDEMHALLWFELGRAREAAAEFAALAAAPHWTPGHSARARAFQLTHVATCLAAAGDTLRMLELASTVEAAGRQSAYGRDGLLHHYIRGLLLSARHQLAQAAEEYRRAIYSWNEGYTRTNYALARTLLELGRPQDAVAALQPAFRGSLEASNLYITRTELHELLARAFDAAGEHDSALVHYRAVESAWRNADPQFRARWQVAKRYTVAGR